MSNSWLSCRRQHRQNNAAKKGTTSRGGGENPNPTTHVTVQPSLFPVSNCNCPQGRGEKRGEARASHGNHTTPKHLLKSQVCKRKGGHLPVSDDGSVRWSRGWCPSESRGFHCLTGGEGMFCGRRGLGGGAGRVSEVSGGDVARHSSSELLLSRE